MVIGLHVLHRLMVRTKFIKKLLKQFTLDKLIAVGGWSGKHNHVELFTMSSLKWTTKQDYPYSKDIAEHSILAVEKKFIIFGGSSTKRKVLTNQDIISNIITKIMKT